MEIDYRAGNPLINGSDRMIVISGCSGGGKSTLIAALKERGHTVFPEPGRQIVKEQLFVGGDALPWADRRAFIRSCVARACFFFNSARSSGDGSIFFDRSLIDAISAWEADGVALPEDLRLTAQRYRYCTRVFMVPPWRDLFSKDAERKHSFEEAVTEYERLMVDYPRYGYSTVPVPRTSIADRVAFIEEHIARRGIVQCLPLDPD